MYGSDTNYLPYTCTCTLHVHMHMFVHYLTHAHVLPLCLRLIVQTPNDDGTWVGAAPSWAHGPGAGASVTPSAHVASSSRSSAT